MSLCMRFEDACQGALKVTGSRGGTEQVQARDMVGLELMPDKHAKSVHGKSLAVPLCMGLGTSRLAEPDSTVVPTRTQHCTRRHHVSRGCLVFWHENGSRSPTAHEMSCTEEATGRIPVCAMGSEGLHPRVVEGPNCGVGAEKQPPETRKPWLAVVACQRDLEDAVPRPLAP